MTPRRRDTADPSRPSMPSLVASLAGLLVGACEPAAPGSPGPLDSAMTATSSPSVAPPATPSAASPATPSAASPATTPTPSVFPVAACVAPSRNAHAAIDASTLGDVAGCVPLGGDDPRPPGSCGQGEPAPALDRGRLERAAPPLDPATVGRISAIAARGREQGRRPRVFGLVGDSMTVSGAFLRALSEASDPRRVVLAPELAPLLGGRPGSDPGETIIGWYRGARAQRVQGVWFDSFRAPRAAKIGARVPWALTGGALSPVERMVRELSPAVAVVLFGGNDAAYAVADPAKLADGFERDLLRLLDVLEGYGIVPVLTTVARHGDSPALDDCGPAGKMTDWRLAVHTSAIHERVVAIACQRQLPLIDLRYAYDALPSRGLGSDGVHPTSYAGGSGVLDARGLQCGYNVRTYLTLRMLQRLREALGW